MNWRLRPRRVAVLGLLGVLGLAAILGAGQVKKQWIDKPSPDLPDLRYGPFERNVLDIWKARPGPKESTSTPLVIFFHGGGFIGGDKSSVPGWFLSRCLEKGISVASANYRLSSQAPYPAPMLDGARAVQFLRLKAQELGIDGDRIGACGNSAGGGISLWIGFHDDLADPSSSDAVPRQSSRLACMGVVGAQTSYDPRFIKQRIGGRAHEHIALKPLFGMAKDATAEPPDVSKLYEDASPLNHVGKGDPPVILFYGESRLPLPPDSRPGQGIHHPKFGDILKEKLDPLGVECILRHSGDYRGHEHREGVMYNDLVEFFSKHLKTSSHR
jgi:acetyl esterase